MRSLDLGLAVADQVTQLTQRPGRHEARTNEAVLDQLATPLRILHITLATRDVTQVSRVVEPALELVLQQIEHRPPVHAGGLHPDHGHRETSQPVRERNQSGGGGRELGHLLAAAAVIVRDAHAHCDLRLVDVEHRAALDQTIHQPSQGSEEQDDRPEEPHAVESESRALGNSSGCPRLSRPTLVRTRWHQAEPTSTKTVDKIATVPGEPRHRRTNIFIRSGRARQGASPLLSRRRHSVRQLRRLLDRAASGSHGESAASATRRKRPWHGSAAGPSDARRGRGWFETGGDGRQLLRGERL